MFQRVGVYRNSACHCAKVMQHKEDWRNLVVGFEATETIGIMKALRPMTRFGSDGRGCIVSAWGILGRMGHRREESCPVPASRPLFWDGSELHRGHSHGMKRRCRSVEGSGRCNSASRSWFKMCVHRWSDGSGAFLLFTSGDCCEDHQQITLHILAYCVYFDHSCHDCCK